MNSVDSQKKIFLLWKEAKKIKKFKILKNTFQFLL